MKEYFKINSRNVFLVDRKENLLHTSPSAALSKDFRIRLHRWGKIAFVSTVAIIFFFLWIDDKLSHYLYQAFHLGKNIAYLGVSR